MKKVFQILIILVGLAPCTVAGAATLGSVVINEIAWMGSAASANDEWIELKNTTAGQINISGWTLQSADGKLKISLKGVIGADGFYLLERTDDTSVPDKTADVIYKGALGNTGENLLLRDGAGNTIDQVNFPSAWPAGNNTNKQTMEKILQHDSGQAATGPARIGYAGSVAGGWQTSQNANGTPKAENSAGMVKVLPNAQKTDTTELASVSESANSATAALFSNPLKSEGVSNPWLLFLTTLVVAIMLAIVTLFIKFKIFKNNEYHQAPPKHLMR